MSNHPLTIDWDALETAVERNAPDTDSFLDRESGQVVTVVAGDPEAAMLRQRIADHIAKYVRIEPASSREQYRWMERFVTSVPDGPLRERLIISIDGKGAFRRFKDVLLGYPAERERWFSYRADLLHWHIHNWMIEAALHHVELPPWGEAKPPPELPQLEGKPVVHGAEAPGELLRRQARELLDGIGAIDLPSAIAFLEFLRQRGRAAGLARESEGRASDAEETAATAAPRRESEHDLDDLDAEAGESARSARGAGAGKAVEGGQPVGRAAAEP